MYTMSRCLGVGRRPFATIKPPAVHFSLARGSCIYVRVAARDSARGGGAGVSREGGGGGRGDGGAGGRKGSTR